MDFDAWMIAVDNEFIRLTGLDRDSWPDQCYYDMWESDYLPHEAVHESIENEYGEEGLNAFNIAY